MAARNLFLLRNIFLLAFCLVPGGSGSETRLWLNKFLKPLDRTQKLSRLDAWRAIGPTGRGHMSSSLGGGAVAWEVAVF